MEVQKAKELVDSFANAAYSAGYYYERNKRAYRNNLARMEELGNQILAELTVDSLDSKEIKDILDGTLQGNPKNT